MIPRRLVRTVPTNTTDQVEQWWSKACALHPDWECVTWRDPIDPAAFPITSPYWADCESGAQLADMVRAEDLYHRGGCYLDSDVEVYRSFEPLTKLDGFAAWDCPEYIPNAVMAFRPGHPAIGRVVALAVQRRHEGTWPAGVGVTTETFRGRDDMVLFPPGSFYPAFWKDAHSGRVNWDTLPQQQPWAYAAHHAHHSWKNAGK